MADFLTAYKVTMGNEGLGEYSNTPNDRGGITFSGITQKNFPDWQGWAIINAAKSQPGFPANLASNLTLKQMVLDFYKNNFWNFSSLDNFADQALATEMFDMSVNMSVHTAGGFLQRALNVLNKNETIYPDIATDGVVGVGTLAALAKANPKDVLKCVVALQGAKYINICENDKTQEKFMAGWIRRAFQEIT